MRLQRRLAALLLAVAFLAHWITATTPRKNLLFLASDDLRPQLGTYQESWAGQHVQMHTPVIDAFANRSMVFLKSYCQQAICMATRASLLTSRRPDTTGVTTALGSYWRKVGGNFTSLPQHFKNNGYTSVGMGKVSCGLVVWPLMRRQRTHGPPRCRIYVDLSPWSLQRRLLCQLLESWAGRPQSTRRRLSLRVDY